MCENFIKIHPHKFDRIHKKQVRKILRTDFGFAFLL